MLILRELCVLCMLCVGMCLRLREVLIAASVQLGRVVGPVRVVGGGDEGHGPTARRGGQIAAGRRSAPSRGRAVTTAGSAGATGVV